MKRPKPLHQKWMGAMAGRGGPSPWRFAGVGLELGAVVAVMAWIGYGFDQWQDTSPVGVIVGASIGIIGGLYNLIKAVMKEQKNQEH